jgi:23S rRNA (pseudouridine1915-N3)-methyltransferase
LRLRIVAVGTRMPAWVTEAVQEYGKRMPVDCAIEWREVRPESRNTGGTARQWVEREAGRIRAALPQGVHLVLLDERGRDLDTRALAGRLERWREQTQPVALVIGGPDGVDPLLRAEAAESLRLSSLTLPHPLVRVLLAEQLYRAWSILSGHPYHRD